ncbi:MULTISPECIES: hypothetical protein [Hyphobacterium]|uniref:DUF945 domain-containing protein n=1 Tax=Hyphobacterium vulgare TaxID=1736751 RepID=A0ABV6ZWT0_9PROT
MRLAQLTTSAAIAVLVAACGGNESQGTTTEVDEATAASALAALHLATSGEGAVSWGERTFDDGVYTFTDVVFADTTPDDDDAEAALTDEDGNAIELDSGSDVDFDAVRAERMIVAAPRFDDDGDVIFDRLSIENATFVGEEGETSEGGFTRLLLENPNAAMVADFARGFSGVEPDEDEDPDFASYRFDNFAFEGLNMASPNADEDFEFTLARFAMSDYQGDRLGRFELSGFGFAGTDPEAGEIRFGFDEMVIENIGPSMIDGVNRGIAAEMASQAGEALVEEAGAVDIDSYNPFDAYDSFRFTGLDANIGGVIVNMDSLSAAIDERAGEVVMTSNMTPLVVRPNTEQAFGAQLALGLGMLGYQQIELQGGSEAVYDLDDDRVYSRGENYFEMTDGFRIEAESDLAGYMAYAREAMRLSTAMQPGDLDGEDMMAIFDPLMINRLVIRLEDHSLLDRALTAGSAAQGMSKDELRQQAGAMISLGLMGVPAEVPRPLVSQLSEALVSFINEGGTITIAVEPEEPISIGTLVRAGETGAFDFDAYGITVSAEPAAE